MIYVKTKKVSAIFEEYVYKRFVLTHAVTPKFSEKGLQSLTRVNMYEMIPRITSNSTTMGNACRQEMALNINSFRLHISEIAQYQSQCDTAANNMNKNIKEMNEFDKKKHIANTRGLHK